MRKISKIEPCVPVMKKRKRVAAYARVSMETERMMHSLSAQVSYYSSLIQSNPEWEYAGVYTDDFISGTSAEKREGFKRLVDDCMNGKIDIVLTKSVSRFARNTVDLLETVRKLKDKGVEVRFEKENISSMSGDGELMLTILASFAQEESRSISENVKWGIRRRMEKGIDSARNKKIFGYRYDGEKYVICEEEAEIVRYIFYRYAEGAAPCEIIKELAEKGIELNFNNISYILQNEIYIGDRRLQKCFVADPLKHNKVKNRGELPQYYISDCHEPIIDRLTFDKAQEIMRKRIEAIPVYPFTKKISCGICGHNFTRKVSFVKGNKYVHWICRSKKNSGITCESVNFSEDDLMKISAAMLGLENFDPDIFLEKVRLITVEKNGDLRFDFSDGSVRIWKNLHPGYKHETSVTDCFQDKIVCGRCGNTYHRVVSGKRHVYWYCMGRKKKLCRSPNYPDFMLRKISAEILDGFSEDVFIEKIEKITVTETGLEFHFYDGRTVKWQKL